MDQNYYQYEEYDDDAYQRGNDDKSSHRSVISSNMSYANDSDAKTHVSSAGYGYPNEIDNISLPLSDNSSIINNQNSDVNSIANNRSNVRIRTQIAASSSISETRSIGSSVDINNNIIQGTRSNNNSHNNSNNNFNNQSRSNSSSSSSSRFTPQTALPIANAVTTTSITRPSDLVSNPSGLSSTSNVNNLQDHVNDKPIKQLYQGQRAHLHEFMDLLQDHAQDLACPPLDGRINDVDDVENIDGDSDQLIFESMNNNNEKDDADGKYDPDEIDDNSDNLGLNFEFTRQQREFLRKIYLCIENDNTTLGQETDIVTIQVLKIVGLLFIIFGLIIMLIGYIWGVIQFGLLNMTWVCKHEINWIVGKQYVTYHIKNILILCWILWIFIFDVFPHFTLLNTNKCNKNKNKDKLTWKDILHIVGGSYHYRKERISLFGYNLFLLYIIYALPLFVMDSQWAAFIISLAALFTLLINIVFVQLDLFDIELSFKKRINHLTAVALLIFALIFIPLPWISLPGSYDQEKETGGAAAYDWIVSYDIWYIACDILLTEKDHLFDEWSFLFRGMNNKPTRMYVLSIFLLGLCVLVGIGLLGTGIINGLQTGDFLDDTAYIIYFAIFIGVFLTTLMSILVAKRKVSGCYQISKNVCLLLCLEPWIKVCNTNSNQNYNVNVSINNDGCYYRCIGCIKCIRACLMRCLQGCCQPYCAACDCICCGPCMKRIDEKWQPRIFKIVAFISCIGIFISVIRLDCIYVYLRGIILICDIWTEKTKCSQLRNQYRKLLGA